MLVIKNDHPVTAAVRGGDLPALRRMLIEEPGLATARVDDGRTSRTLLHVATDWPGHYPNGVAVVTALIAAGAEVHGRFAGPHTETALHWAASTDDVDVLDVLLDAGADIDAPGAVIGSGTPLDDATAFAQWNAAHRLVERGAATTLWHAATLGLADRLRGYFAGAGRPSPPSLPEINNALWGACHGGQRPAAEFLLAQGADVNWIPAWERLTPLDAAFRSEATSLAEWLRGRGGRLAAELR
ncbi:ankyrin repeat domain-containing protein [Actinoplanes solisilvae]|uniref:ankyrin repeat domain-containing protein n=1 Tax=Actinoplanes solisilvae TaxID=2486853 RepID=UPI000FD7A2FB|nr:ankyrin repeat domain-containing protein [Actinoplanes solisilvae]